MTRWKIDAEDNCSSPKSDEVVEEEEKEVEHGKKEVDDGGGEGEESSLERKSSYGGRVMEKSSGFRQV